MAFTLGMQGWFNIKKPIKVLHHMELMRRNDQFLILKKVLNKIRIDGYFLKMKKIYLSSKPSIIRNGKMLVDFILKSGTRVGGWAKTDERD